MPLALMGIGDKTVTVTHAAGTLADIHPAGLIEVHGIKATITVAEDR